MKSLMVCVSLLMLVGSLHAQSDQTELANLQDAVKKTVSNEMRGWQYRSIQPIEGSKGLIIQQWQLNDIIVNVAVSAYEKAPQAEAAFRDFKNQLRVEEQARTKDHGPPFRLIKENSHAWGDEAFVFDVRGSEAVAFRKGRFLVNISLPEPANNKDVFFSRKFAEHVVKALDLN